MLTISYFVVILCVQLLALCSWLCQVPDLHLPSYTKKNVQDFPVLLSYSISLNTKPEGHSVIIFRVFIQFPLKN